jgi:hypothetical protein
VVSPDALSPTPSTSSAMKTQEWNEMKYFSHQLCSSSTGTVTKKKITCTNLGQYRYCLVWISDNLAPVQPRTSKVNRSLLYYIITYKTNTVVWKLT